MKSPVSERRDGERSLALKIAPLGIREMQNPLHKRSESL